MAEQIIGLICCLLCAFPLFIMSHYNKDSREPIVFWARDVSLKEKVKDVSGYNAEIAVLYRYCALAFVLTGILFFIYKAAAYTGIGFVCTLGIFIVWKRYKTILRKHS